MRRHIVPSTVTPRTRAQMKMMREMIQYDPIDSDMPYWHGRPLPVQPGLAASYRRKPDDQARACWSASWILILSSLCNLIISLGFCLSFTLVDLKVSTPGRAYRSWQSESLSDPTDAQSGCHSGTCLHYRRAEWETSRFRTECRQGLLNAGDSASE